MKVLHSHPGISGRFVKQTAFAYYEAGMLERLCTTFLVHPDYWLSKLMMRVLPENIKKEINKRLLTQMEWAKIRAFPYRELLRIMASRYTNQVVADRIWKWAEDGFDHWVSGNLNHRVNAIHAYENAALFTFRRAREKDIFCIYEQPSASHSYVENEVLQKYLFTEKEFKDQYTAIYPSDLLNRRNHRKDEELKLANLLICNSSYTLKTLIYSNVSHKKIIVMPLGFPEVKEIPEKLPAEQVRFLVAGNLSYMKGVHHVLRIWKKYGNHLNANLTLIGTNMLAREEWQGLPGNVRVVNRLPQPEFLQEMANADVFITFTYTDGFGQVITEAMSRGLPVITTENSAGPDLITHRKDGLIVRIGDEKDLYQQMKWCVENKHLLPQMGYAAVEKAKTWPWPAYRKRLVEVIKDEYQKWKERKVFAS